MPGIRQTLSNWWANRLKTKQENEALKKLNRLLNSKAIRARYESAQTTDENTNHWTLSDDYAPSQSLTPTVRQKIRRRARYEARENNSYANGIINTIVDEIFGKGPTIQFPELKLKDSIKIQRAFRQWLADSGMHEKIRIMGMAEYIEGESVGVLINNNNAKNNVKLDLQVLEPDYLEPAHLDMTKYPDAIDFDQFGNPTRYHLLKEHPGSGYNTGEGTWFAAQYILHLFRQERAGQVRGVSRLAPCLTLFSILRRFTLATVEAAETAASFAAILSSDPDPAGAANLGEDEWFDAIPIIHRALMTIPKGWSATQMKAEHPTSTYADFKRELLNEICRCLGVPLNIALANSSGYNYASGRLDHLTFYRMVAVEQQRYERTIYDRLFELWYREAWLLGDDTVPRSVKPEKLHWVWTWDRGRNADPLKEAMADKERVAACMMTYSEYFAERGKNWEEEFAQIAKERKMLLQNNISPDIILPATPEVGEEGPSEGPPPKKKTSLREQVRQAWTAEKRRAFDEIVNADQAT